MTDARILFWDIENTPLEVFAWGLWDQNISTNMVRRTSEILCYGAKWLGKPVEVVDQRIGYVEMLTRLRDTLTDADFVVSWNGQKFDTKKANTEFVKHGLTPPAPYKEIDLMRVARSRMAFPSNKLDFVAQQLGVGKKVDTGGFQLWLDVMAGDKKAWSKMRRYQKQDVQLLEKLYKAMLPWIKFPHPVRDGFDKCRNCGSSDIQWRGKAITLNGSYARFQCKNCGAWGRDNARVPATNVSAIS